MPRVSSELRRFVTERASNCCEYCLLNQDEFPYAFHIEHIRAEKHGGQTVLENLCLSCPVCNSYKGSDLGSIDEETDLLTPLFHPRTQNWSRHFQLNASQIEPLTPEGRVTVFLLRLNSAERLVERELLIRLNRYPCFPDT